MKNLREQQYDVNERDVCLRDGLDVLLENLQEMSGDNAARMRAMDEYRKRLAL